jgi:hypothetical protein
MHKNDLDTRAAKRPAFVKREANNGNKQSSIQAISFRDCEASAALAIPLTSDRGHHLGIFLGLYPAMTKPKRLTRNQFGTIF